MELVNHTKLLLTVQNGQVQPPANSLTIIVKGTFDLVPGAACVPSAEQLPFSRDQLFMDETGRSLCWADDLVAFKPNTDIFFFGSFHQPAGEPVTTGLGGFQIGPFKKMLRFHGPRTAAPNANGGWDIVRSETCTSVPLRWELSLGGLNDPTNPMGCGLDRGSTFCLPQIEWPDQPFRPGSPVPKPANLAPVPPSFALRAAKRGTFDRQWSVFRAPLPPKDFDLSFHNAAPADQQAGNFPNGDETLTLWNLHPTIPLLETRLPGLKPRVGLLRGSAAEFVAEEVTMNLDTVVPMPDQDRLVLLWRGVIAPVADAETSDIIWVQASMERSDQLPIPFKTIAADMRQRHAAENPDEAAALAEDIAAGMAEVHSKLAKVPGLPPALLTMAQAGGDPSKLYEALMSYVHHTLTELEAKLP